MAKIYGERWKVVGDLGEGGQSRVYRVVDASGRLSGEFALKRVLNPARHERFRNEVQAIKRLNDPHIIQLVDHSALDEDPPPERPFLVMQLAPGGNLSERKEAFKDSLDSVLIVAKQVCGALIAAHGANVIHRDIKPENILFLSASNDIVVSDFGICLIREEEQPRATLPNEVVGPRAFLAPEAEAGGILNVAPSADIYSLGKLIFFMISGGLILPRERLGEEPYRHVLSGGERYTLLRHLLGKMVCSVSSRLSTAESVMKELESIQTWEQRARSVPLNSDTFATLERLKQRELENQSEVAAAQTWEEDQRASVAAVREMFLKWLNVTLVQISEVIRSNGLLEAAVEDIQSPNQIQARFGRAAALSAPGGRALTLTMSRGFQKRKRTIQFTLYEGGVVNVQIQPQTGPVAAIKRTEKILVFLPTVVGPQTVGTRARNSPTLFLIYDPSGKVQFSTSTPTEQSSVHVSFRPSDWPQVADKLSLVIEESFAAFVKMVESEP